ncbi:MAG: tRNA (5-methylaminomethyl-2-thiouridine)(34)-methyltransferase MnmD [Pseudomonadota bacterium]
MADLDRNLPTDQSEITWRESVPVSARFDDPYYSLENGLAETRHVFLAGNDLPARFSDGFHIAELGFGTGLNLLTAALAWRESGTAGRLHFTSFELYRLPPDVSQAAHRAFPELTDLAAELTPLWDGATSLTLDWLNVTIIEGDARETLPLWRAKADAWFLDGFSPARNPELWEPPLLTTVAQHTNTQGTCATYSAAGAVRRALDTAGFDVTRIPGYGRKRHMTRGVLR